MALPIEDTWLRQAALCLTVAEQLGTRTKAVGNPYGFTFMRRNSLCSWFLDRRCSCIGGRCVGQPYDFTHADPCSGCDEHEIIS